MKKEKGLSVTGLTDQLSATLQKVRRYRFIAFLIFVGLVYGFVLLRIHNLDTAQPPSAAVNSQVKAAQIPHIDQAVVRQLQSLQDHSVSVQALFDQARNNPFQ